MFWGKQINCIMSTLTLSFYWMLSSNMRISELMLLSYHNTNGRQTMIILSILLDRRNRVHHCLMKNNYFFTFADSSFFILFKSVCYYNVDLYIKNVFLPALYRKSIVCSICPMEMENITSVVCICILYYIFLYVTAWKCSSS